MSGQIYQSGAGPKYILGHSWSLGCLAFAWINWWFIRALYRRREAAKNRLLAEDAVDSSEEFTDRSPDFRYQI